MEDLEQSSLEEKVDLRNFVFFPPDSYVNKETGEANFRIKDEPSEIKINDDISENNNNDIKEETIEVPVDGYEKETNEFSNNGNEMCQICGLEFGNKTVLKIHISTVHPKNFKTAILEEKAMHKCSVCTYKAKNRTSLKVHIGIVHERTRKHECSICNAGYSSRSSLKAHIDRVHEGKKGQQCSLCDASFPNKRKLDDHVQVVHKGKKFECTLCDTAKYNQRRNLSLHIRTVHEGMGMKHACTVCSYSFNSKAILRRHVETVHEGKKPFRLTFVMQSLLENLL